MVMETMLVHDIWVNEPNIIDSSSFAFEFLPSAKYSAYNYACNERDELMT
jgi:hypothetical protein